MAIWGVIVTLAISLATIAFNLGKIAARVESLEQWRVMIRVDMHEISDKLQTIVTNQESLTTLINERTERRSAPRTRND